jgi:hypothetical protein
MGLIAFGTTCRAATRQPEAPSARVDVIARRDREHLTAHEPGERGRVDDPERQQYPGEPSAQHRAERQRQHQRRKREHRIHHAHHEAVHAPAAVAGHDPEQAARADREDDRDETGHQ